MTAGSLLLLAPADGIAKSPDEQSDSGVQTMTECYYVGQDDAGTVKVTYRPDFGHKLPAYIEWQKQLANDQGSANLRAGWQSGNYSPPFADYAQFNITVSPNEKGPKLARVEIHPWAYRYNHWGMRFGATSSRGKDNYYHASGFWPTLIDLEKRADKLFIRVQKITSDTPNNNYIGNSVLSLELPEKLFQRADALVAQSIAKGNELMASGAADCKQVPNPPIIVT